MPEDKFITIIQFDSIIEANIVKSLLEDNGVSSILADENLLSVNPLYSNAIGRIKLQVFESDRNAAYAILKENDYDFKVSEKGDNIHAEPCAKCKSRNVHTERPGIFFIIFSSLFLFIPLILRKRNWKCHDCNYQWVEPITSNKIFFSLLLLPVLLIIWGCIYSEIKEYLESNEYQIMDQYEK